MSEPSLTGDRSILRVHVWIVLAMAALTTGVALVVALGQGRSHVAEARVEVLQTPTRGAPIVPDMGTEREVATSGEVARGAAARMSTSTDRASEGLSVSVVTDTNVLTLQYAAPDAESALRGAEAFTRSYVAVRNADLKVHVVSTITDAHVLPGSRGRPVPLVVGVGLVVGLGLGAAAAWVWDRLRGLVRSTGELERAGLVVMATGLEVAEDPGPGYGYLAGQLMALTDEQQDTVRVLVTGVGDSGLARAVGTRLADVLSGHGRSVELVSADVPHQARRNGVAVGSGTVVVETSRRLLDDPETWVVAQRADVVLLAVRVGRLRRRDVDLAVRALSNVQGPVVACVTCRRGAPGEHTVGPRAPRPALPHLAARLEPPVREPRATRPGARVAGSAAWPWPWSWSQGWGAGWEPWVS